MYIAYFDSINKQDGYSYDSFRLGKVDPVLAVRIWVGFGPELGSEKNIEK